MAATSQPRRKDGAVFPRKHPQWVADKIAAVESTSRDVDLSCVKMARDCISFRIIISASEPKRGLTRHIRNSNRRPIPRNRDTQIHGAKSRGPIQFHHRARPFP
jgi:hypothetical protein